MRRQKRILLRTILIAAALQILTVGVAFILGHRAVPRIQIMDLTTKKWTSIIPERNMKLYCYVTEGFVPCARIFQDSDAVRDLLGPSVVIIPDETNASKSKDRDRLPGTAFKNLDPGPTILN